MELQIAVAGRSDATPCVQIFQSRTAKRFAFGYNPTDVFRRTCTPRVFGGIRLLPKMLSLAPVLRALFPVPCVVAVNKKCPVLASLVIEQYAAATIGKKLNASITLAA